MKHTITILALLTVIGCSHIHPQTGRTSIGRDVGAESFEVTYDATTGKPTSMSYVAIDATESKAFRDAMLAAGMVAIANIQAGVDKAKSADQREVATTGMKEAGATDRAAIGATERTATSVGNNPEANSTAINSVGNLFKRR
jgi:hypothetical protein